MFDRRAFGTKYAYGAVSVPSLPETIGSGDHLVLFYERDAELIEPLADYVGGAITEGAVAIVVATADHHRALRGSLAAAGVEVGDAEADGRFIALPAEATLSALRGETGIDRRLFDIVVGGLMRKVCDRGLPVRAYGEMVGVLWDEGDVARVIELESLWNDLGAELDFALLCGYPATADVEAVWTQHSCVVSRPSRSPHAQPHRHGAAEETRTFGADGVVDARLFVTETLRRWHDDDLLSDAALVVTELVANALTHAGPRFTVSVADAGDRVRISVADGSGAVPVERDPDPWSSHGRGLKLVSSIADRWGVDPFGEGKTVWAELVRRRPPP
jgi:anti-sigma regulatory factor (Ser/Thr protein kinase)